MKQQCILLMRHGIALQKMSLDTSVLKNYNQISNNTCAYIYPSITYDPNHLKESK